MNEQRVREIVREEISKEKETIAETMVSAQKFFNERGVLTSKIQTHGLPNESEQSKSPASIKQFLDNNVSDEYAGVVAEVLGFLGKQGTTVEAAVYILKCSQKAIEKCTVLQDEYTP